MHVHHIALLSAMLACSSAEAQSCFDDVCLGQTVEDVAKLRWNPAKHRKVDPRWASEWLRTTRYVGPAYALNALLALSTFDEKTVLVLNQLRGACGPGLGPRLKRGEETDDNVIVDIEPVPAPDGLTQRFEVVEINVYLRQDKPTHAAQLAKLCHRLIAVSNVESQEAGAQCQSGWAQQETADGKAKIAISNDGVFTRVNMQRIGGWFEQRDPRLLGQLPACAVRSVSSP